MGIYVQQSNDQVKVNLASNPGSVFNGATGNFDVILDVNIDNNLVNIHFSQFIGNTGPNGFPIVFQLPGNLQPKNLENFKIVGLIFNTANQTDCLMTVFTNGLVSIGLFPDNDPFPQNAMAGYIDFSINYIITDLPT